MNNLFELNKVYSNVAFYAAAANSILNLAKFSTSLYKENPENCPWPKTMGYFRRMINEIKEVFAYFVVVRKTAHYIYLSENGRVERKLKLRKDDEGNEFVIIDGNVLHAKEALNYTPDEATIIYENNKLEISCMNNFLRSLGEIEEYGYTYVMLPSEKFDLSFPASKICSESELREALRFCAWQ